MLSEDSKWRIVKAYEKGEKVKEIARCFGINPSSVYDILKQYKETGNVEIRTYKRGRKQKLTAEQLEQIRKEIEVNNDITMEEIKEKYNLPVNEETVRRKVHEMGYRHKKKTIHALERERSRCGSEKK